MTYNVTKLMNITGSLLSGTMVLGIVVLIFYTLFYDKRDPEICLSFGGIPGIMNGKPICNLEK